MKYLLWFLLLCSTALAQQLNGTTQFATILPDFQGRIIQYAFPVTPFEGWVERQHLKKYKWESVPNTVQVQTVDGVTQLNLIDTHDICGPKAGPVGACEYLGTLLGPLQITEEFLYAGSYQHVSGTFVGTFTDAQGYVFRDVFALLDFDTFPTVDTVNVPDHGGVTIVLQYNGAQ